MQISMWCSLFTKYNLDLESTCLPLSDLGSQADLDRYFDSKFPVDFRILTRL